MAHWYHSAAGVFSLRIAETEKTSEVQARRSGLSSLQSLAEDQ